MNQDLEWFGSVVHDSEVIPGSFIVKGSRDQVHILLVANRHDSGAGLRHQDDLEAVVGMFRHLLAGQETEQHTFASSAFIDAFQHKFGGVELAQGRYVDVHAGSLPRQQQKGRARFPSHLLMLTPRQKVEQTT